jgi:DNA-directed RNA polymerase beta subunit
MEHFEKLVNKEVKELLADEPEKQARATAIAKKIFQWLDEGGVGRIEEGLKQEVVAIEKVFEKQEEKISEHLEER